MKEYSDFWPKVTGETKRKRRELVAARLREPLSPWNGESRLFSRKELVKRGSSWVACALKRSEEGELLGVELELGLSHRTWEQAQQLADMFEIEPEGRLILLPEMELVVRAERSLVPS